MPDSVNTSVEITPTNETHISNTIDSTHPYYLHPSDAPGMNLVSSVFDGRGFAGWKRAMLIALSAKNKTGFIDGTLCKPGSDSSTLGAWTRCNDMVLSWLLNSLSKEIAESVLYSQTAKVLWTDLETRFGQANGAKLFQLQKELNQLVQGNLSVASYFTKLKCVWDELDAINAGSNCVCECKCEGKAKYVKAKEDERVLQFLMGLNECFLNARRNILMCSPLPSIGSAYSLVIQDEKQGEIHPNGPYPGDSASFMATGKTIQPGSANSSAESASLIAAIKNAWNRKPNQKFSKNQKGSYERTKVNLWCTHCNKDNHSTENCYRKNGFPADFKFTNNQNQGKTQPRANSAFSGSQNEGKEAKGTDQNGVVNFLTQDHLAQIAQLVQQFKMDQPGTSAGANYAGPFSEEPSGSW